ncbi:MAG: sigma-70 family RNA polymerase sigma factor [Clostridia bacterium]|nr:sigma-70 family RNA polymerase sigma factor [Clostridia bacterium]
MQTTKSNIDINYAIDKYSNMVYRLAVSRVGKKDIADDVYQEVFIRLNRNINKIESESHLKNWLIKVTINCSKTELMSKWNNIEELPEDIKFETEEHHEIFEEVQKLDEKYRTVIHLFYYEDMKISEIAEMLDTNESTIKTWLSRARDILRKALGGDENEW